MVSSVLPTTSLPLTSLYGGAVGLLLALLSLQAFLYRGSKGPKAYFGDQNTPEAPQLQSIVRVSRILRETACTYSQMTYVMTRVCLLTVPGQPCGVLCRFLPVVRVVGVQQSSRNLYAERAGAGVSCKLLCRALATVKLMSCQREAARA